MEVDDERVLHVLAGRRVVADRCLDGIERRIVEVVRNSADDDVGARGACAVTDGVGADGARRSERQCSYQQERSSESLHLVSPFL